MVKNTYARGKLPSAGLKARLRARARLHARLRADRADEDKQFDIFNSDR